jgi:hypothetical protein
MTKDIAQDLQDYFSGVQFSHLITDVGDLNVHAIFIDIIENKELQNKWEEIVNFIALKFQNALTSEFERWNLYLFFRTNEVVDRDLKHKIENDTFSSRKIIIGENMSNDQAIEKYVTNKFVSLGSQSIEELSDFQYDPVIFEILTDRTLRTKNIKPEEANNALDELIKLIEKNNEV